MTDNLPAIPDYVEPLDDQVNFEYRGDVYTVKNNKLYRPNGSVAVVYSPGYGGGWSSWAKIDPTDARVAVLTLVKGAARLRDIIKDEPDREIVVANGYGWLYAESFDRNGLNDSLKDPLEIAWLKPGTAYRIDEYDGFESIERQSSVDWNIA